jgi:hypothetical protein
VPSDVIDAQAAGVERFSLEVAALAVTEAVSAGCNDRTKRRRLDPLSDQFSQEFDGDRRSRGPMWVIHQEQDRLSGGRRFVQELPKLGVCTNRLPHDVAPA